MFHFLEKINKSVKLLPANSIFSPFFHVTYPTTQQRLINQKLSLPLFSWKHRALLRLAPKRSSFYFFIFLPAAILFCSDCAEAESVCHEAALCVTRCHDNSCRTVWLRWKHVEWIKIKTLHIALPDCCLLQMFYLD